MSLFHPVHKCTFIYCPANSLRVLLIMKFTIYIYNLRLTINCCGDRSGAPAATGRAAGRFARVSSA